MLSLISLAVKNLRHNSRSYAAFFLSSTFAVWMFYLFGSLVDHPDLVKLAENSAFLRQILTALEVLIALFSVFFIRYSHAAFIRARQTEMGTLTILGMPGRRIRRMVLAEALLLGAGAIALALALGAVFARLFYLGWSAAMAIGDLSFYFSWKTAAIATPVFLGVFALTALWTGWSIRRLSVADVLRGAVKARAAPRFSLWLVALCAALLGAGYWLAATADQENAQDRVQVVLLLLCAGTYLFFTQASVGLLRFLQRRRRTYYDRTRLITIAQLAYKVRDNALVLFMVAILASLSLAGLGATYGRYFTITQRIEQDMRADLTIVGAPGGVGPERVEAILEQQGNQVLQRFDVPVLRTGYVLAYPGGEEHAERVGVAPLTPFNRWWTYLGHEPLVLTDGKPTMLINRGKWADQFTVKLMPGGEGVTNSALPLAELTVNKLFADPVFYAYVHQAGALVLSDDDFARLSAQIGADPCYLWLFRDWKASRPPLRAMSEAMVMGGADHPGELIASRINLYDSVLSGNAFYLFVMCFFGVLFFLASGNMLYFKLFNDLNDDQRQFRSLYKVGLKVSEIRRIVSAQALVMFAAPVAVAVINGGLAVMLYGRQYSVSLLRPLALVSAIFAGLYGIYYLVTRQTYVSTLLGRTMR